MTENLADLKVLYVEDEPDLRILMSELLTFMGYTVTCAANGQQGVEKAISWQPDVILMDVRMPVVDGPSAVRLLRQNPATQHIPVYMLSAYSDHNTRTMCEQAGANGFFVKPPDIAKIDATLKKVLSHRKK